MILNRMSARRCAKIRLIVCEKTWGLDPASTTYQPSLRKQERSHVEESPFETGHQSLDDLAWDYGTRPAGRLDRGSTYLLERIGHYQLDRPRPVGFVDHH